MAQINSVSCIQWIPQGVARKIPDKVEMSKDLLQKLIAETSEKLEKIDMIKDDEYSTLELESEENELKLCKDIKKREVKEKANEDIDQEMADSSEENQIKEEEEQREDNSVVKEYNFDAYDDEPDIVDSDLLKLGRLTVYASPEEDPHITEKDEEEEETEKEDFEIAATDNLIGVGHVEGYAVTLEVYVYNEKQESLYVHHDINLSSVPFCLEWLNVDPVDENQLPGNMLAVGSLSPVVEVWDLDVVDTQKPAFTLGRKAKKKKKIAASGHRDAVLCLGWNKELHHILASGSCDKTVILWDLHTCEEAQRVTFFLDKVQDLQWHHSGKQLLTGSCDRFLRLTDCISNDTLSWKLDGEVESVSWGNCQQNNSIYASTDKGTLYCCDPRHTKPLWKTSAHEKACTNITFSSSCPGCLITVSEDETVKIWDVLSNQPELIGSRNPNLGVIYTVSSCPDSPFVIAMGGDNKRNNFKVWDIRHSIDVRRRFCDRVGLPVDEDNVNASDEDDDTEVADHEEDEEMEYEKETGGVLSVPGKVRAKESSRSCNKEGWRPNKKSKKKKGGHLDRKKH